jgi:hypothetical protein
VDLHAIKIGHQFHHYVPCKVPSSPRLIDWKHYANLHAIEVHSPIADFDENAIRAHSQLKIHSKPP